MFFLLFLLLCFSALLLLCLSTYTFSFSAVMRFCCSASSCSFASLLPFFTVSLLFFIFCFFILYCILNETLDETQRHPNKYPQMKTYINETLKINDTLKNP